jgi:hypothetical protein
MATKKGEKKVVAEEVETPVVSLAKIQIEAKPIENEIVALRESAEALTIKSDDDYKGASDFLDMVNTKKKNADKMRKFFVEPLNHQVDNINALFMPQVKEADEIVKVVKGKMAVFYNEQEAKRVAEQKRLDDIRIAADKKRAEEGKEAIAVPVREVAMPTKTVATGSSKAQVRKVWTHEIEHLDQLPEDIKKAILGEAWQKGIVKTVVQKFVDAGIREMAGVRIFEETRIASGNVRQY